MASSFNVKEIEKSNKIALLESLLFVAGEPVSILTVQETLEVNEPMAKSLLHFLKMKYEGDSNTGIELQSANDEYWLCTKKAYGEVLKEKYAEPVSLSSAALETLAIVAFKAPVTKTQIEALRGVGSERSIMTLLEKELIMECGRANLPGKPVLYDVTPLFRRRSGWDGISISVPDYQKDKQETLYLENE